MKTRGTTRTGLRHGTIAAVALGAGLLTSSMAHAAEPVKEVVVSPTTMQTQRVNWKPASARGGFGTRGPGCTQITASVANQFNSVDIGSEITLQAGMVEGEGFGSTYIVADPIPGTPLVNEAFPVEVNLIEFIAGTAAALSGSDGSLVRLGWSIELWDGEPNVGTSNVVFTVASNPDPSMTGLPGDLMLQRVSGTCDEITVLLGGAPANAGKVQFSVDQTADPLDRMIVPGNALDSTGAKLNRFTVIVKIAVHNAPGATACSSVNLCNNVFLATEGTTINGSANNLTYSTRNWLYAVQCAGGAPAGYSRFSSLSTSFRPTRDVLQQVTYTPAACAGAATGACCAGTGTCSVVTQATCTGTSAYQGDSTTCGTSTCPTGACCAVAGTCATTTSTGCTAGSTFRGAGTVCSPNPCPQPSGACCAVGGTCSVLTAVACGSGTFGGANTTCNAQSCPGACCIGTGCLTATLSDCGNVGGTYQASGSACASGACPTGACCITNSGSCSVATPAACRTQGGIFGGNASACNTTFCPLPTGACCATNGFCLASQTQQACINVGFTWQGGGTVCSPNPCQQQQQGVCCRGTTCATGVAQGSCTSPASGVGALFVSASAACNSTGVNNAPCCYADFNKANGIAVQDIFDYLNAWFSASPYCKIGGNGTATPIVQDIFGFLNAWFTGC